MEPARKVRDHRINLQAAATVAAIADIVEPTGKVRDLRHQLQAEAIAQEIARLFDLTYLPFKVVDGGV